MYIRRNVLAGTTNKMDRYLTIEAVSDNVTAALSLNACEYCIDGDENWTYLPANTKTTTINAGQTLSFRANLTPTTGGHGAQGTTGIGKFTVNGQFNLKGNCGSMLFGDNANENLSLAEKPYAFKYLFYNNSGLITVSDNFLPALILSNNCYCAMFYNCTSLVNSPNLPATSLATACYDSLFLYCSSLVDSRAIVANVLVTRSCYQMYYGCSKLTSATLLATELGEESCLHNWLRSTATPFTVYVHPSMLSADFHTPTSGYTKVAYQ